MKRVMIILSALILLSANVFALTKPVNVRDYNMNYTGAGTGLLDYNGINQPGTLYRDNQCHPCQGGEGRGSHPGVDIPCDVGTEVRSIASGRVIHARCGSVGACCNQGSDQCTGWGKYVMIQHDIPNVGRIYSIYAHLSSLDVAEEDDEGNPVDVPENYLIGLSGSTGYSTAAHLHFQIDRELRLDTGEPVDDDDEHPYWFQGVNSLDAQHEIENNTINPMPFLQMGNYRPCYMPVGFVLNADYTERPSWRTSGTDGVSQLFRARYDQFYQNSDNDGDGVDEKTALGFPWHNPLNPSWMVHGSAVHRVANMWIQDFYGPHNGVQGNPHTSLIKHDQHDVHLLKGGFWDFWMHNCGWVTCGAPIDEEHLEGEVTHQQFANNVKLAWEAPWPDIENAQTGQSLTINSCTFITPSSSRDADGVYHSGSFVTAFNSPIELLNGSTYSGFYGIISGEQVNINQFTVNGDMTIEVNGCGLPYPTGVTASEDECFGVVVEWDDILPNDQYYYRVLRNGVELVDYVWWTLTSYSDTSAADGVYYNYSVQIRLNEECISDQSLADPGRQRSPVIAAPSNCNASESECNVIIVSWQDNSNDEDGFWIYRDGFVHESTPANATSFTDTPAGDFHSYYVQAYNVCGPSDTSNHDNGERVTAVPPQVQYLWASNDSCQAVFVTWLDVIIETSYRVYRNGTLLGAVPVDVTNYADYTAVPETPYNYSIIPVRGNCPGLISPSVIGLKQGTPAAPSNCLASETECNDIIVTWTDNSDSEAGFRIFRDDAVIDNTEADANSYHDVNPIGLATYRVRSFDACNNFNDSNSDQGHTIDPPPQVQGISATDDRCDDVIVTWSDVTGESGYLVYRDGIQVGNVLPTNAISYSDATGDHGIPFQYTVSALNSNCQGPQSLPENGQRIVCCYPSPDTSWTRTYGTWDNEFGRSVAQTEDGGFAFTGMATSVGDAYVVRVDSNGTQIWNYWYSDAPELRAYAIITRPSGFAVVGTRQFNYDNNMFLLLINESGGIQALNSFGGTEDDVANCVISTADGGLLLAGGTSSFGAQGSDMYVVKTDGAGNFQWQRSYGRSWSDGVFAVDRTQDGGYIFAGYTTNIYRDFWILRTNSLGDTLWTKSFGGPSDEEAHAVKTLPNGGFAVFGWTQSFGAGGKDYYLVRTNSNGDTLWTRTYGGENDEYGYAMDVSESGNILMAGSTRSFGQCGDDMYAVVVNAVGDVQCARTYGGIGSEAAYGCEILQDGRFVLAGHTTTYGAGQYDFYAVKSASSWISLDAPEVVIHSMDNDIHLNWANTSAPFYRIYSDTLSEGNFTTLEGITSSTSFVDSGAVNVSDRRFYKVVSSAE